MIHYRLASRSPDSVMIGKLKIALGQTILTEDSVMQHSRYPGYLLDIQSIFNILCGEEFLRINSLRVSPR